MFQRNYSASPTPGGSESLVKDSNWHFICMNRDNANGDMALYIDGTKRKSKILAPGMAPEVGGTMYLGAISSGHTNFKGQLSGVNIWDRLLTDSEIANMATSCGRASGNVIDWFEIKEKLPEDKFEFIIPSDCSNSE